MGGEGEGEGNISVWDGAQQGSQLQYIECQLTHLVAMDTNPSVVGQSLESCLGSTESVQANDRHTCYSFVQTCISRVSVCVAVARTRQ